MINYGEGGIDHDLCMTSIHIFFYIIVFENIYANSKTTIRTITHQPNTIKYNQSSNISNQIN